MDNATEGVGARWPATTFLLLDVLLSAAAGMSAGGALSTQGGSRQPPRSAVATVSDLRADVDLRLRNIEVKRLGHSTTGGPGGHFCCERRGAPLTALCAQFLHDV